MTAEPRMEELLASIRKAIHDDIGVVPASTSAQASGTLQRGAMRELHVKVGEAAGSAAAEIQHLREKINRSRGPVAPAREQPQRMAAPAHESAYHESGYQEPARRSWRELEPAPPLRPSLMDSDAFAPPSARRIPDQPRYEATAESQPASDPYVWQPPDTAATLPPPGPRSTAHESGMLSRDASEAVQTAFNQLAESMFSRAAGERSLEDIAREMLRGMLKQWLDDNLPALVERLVREEIERVARRGR